jgi:hypothetical protein
VAFGVAIDEVGRVTAHKVEEQLGDDEATEDDKTGGYTTLYLIALFLFYDLFFVGFHNVTNELLFIVDDWLFLEFKEMAPQIRFAKIQINFREDLFFSRIIC